MLDRIHEDRVIIQEFRPFWQSLEWELGQAYWHTRGSQAFIGDAIPVPYAINNNGAMSVRAADVLFHNLGEAEQVGPLPSNLVVLELGIGVGLFARFFLDAFRERCVNSGKDYYDRLTYVLADRSPAMLNDIGRHGLLREHFGRFVLRVVDAFEPETLLHDPVLAISPRSIRAVFLNYVLDCLPATVIEIAGEDLRELQIRTCLARGISLDEFHPWSPAQLRSKAEALEWRDKQDLLKVFGFLASEYRFDPVEKSVIPLVDLAIPLAKPDRPQVLHNFGALQSLGHLLTMVADGGFLLINDYGQAEGGSVETWEHQRFSGSTSVGLNFPLLEAFAKAKNLVWEKPKDDYGHIYSRLLAPSPIPQTISHFQEVFSKASFEKTDEKMAHARHWSRAGFLENAISAYSKALNGQPYDWLLLSEAAEFVLFGMNSPKVALGLARRALELNTTCSADLWNVFGDCLYALGRIEEARSAYFRALEINPEDVRSRYNLAWVYVLRKEYVAALAALSEGLALDKLGQYRDRLLQKQVEVLSLMASRTSKEFFVMANRVRHLSAEPEKPTTATPLRSIKIA